MPVSQKSKTTRGIPRKSRNGARKQRHGRYWDRATCAPCGLVFRSPKRAKLHKASGHTLKPALRRTHAGSVEIRLQEIAAGMGKRKG